MSSPNAEVSRCYYAKNYEVKMGSAGSIVCGVQALRSEMMTIQAMMEAMMIRLEDLERRLDHPDQGGGSGSRSKMFGIL